MDNYMDDLKDFESTLIYNMEETYEEFKDRFFKECFNKAKTKIKENYELGIKSFTYPVPNTLAKENYLMRIGEEYFFNKVFFKLIGQSYDLSLNGTKYFIEFYWK